MTNESVGVVAFFLVFNTYIWPFFLAFAGLRVERFVMHHAMRPHYRPIACELRATWNLNSF